LGVSTVFGVSVAATVVAGCSVSCLNVAAYKLLFSYCLKGSSGTIGWAESGGNIIAFALPLIYGAIVDASDASNKSSSLRIGMCLPAVLLALSVPLLYGIYWRARRKEAKREGSFTEMSESSK
jgi:nitrate/nitrite transporter NarK